MSLDTLHVIKSKVSTLGPIVVCPSCDHCLYDAWERMTYGGVQIEWYDKVDYDRWLREAEAYLASY